MMSVWPWISLEKDIFWIWNLRKSYIQCHNNLVLVPPRKPPNRVKYIYSGQAYDLKTRVDIWTRMDVVAVDYGKINHTFHLTMWFFQFITVISFEWDHLIWISIALLVWIALWTKLRIYRVTTEPVRWSYRGFGFLLRAFMLNWILWTKNDFKVSHRKQVNDPSNMNLVTSLMNF